MQKSGEPCKHYLAAWLDAERKREQAEDEARIAEYEAEADARALQADMNLAAVLHRQGITY
jgi:hypothetical protein